MKETRRSIELELEVPGAPEEVWRAIASGPGITAWFVPTEVDERVGGEICFRLPIGMESTGQITAWQPPHRLVYEERDWAPGAPPLATEMHVEARAGGTCVVRLVTSLFASTDDWDDQLDSMKAGWPPFLRILALYLTHFAGQRCTPIQAHGGGGASVEESWRALSRALGLGATPGEGFRAPPGAPPFAGVIDRLGAAGEQREIVALLSDPAPGAALIAVNQWGGVVHASLSLYLYGGDAAETARRDQPVWADWMARHFPPA